MLIWYLNYLLFKLEYWIIYFISLRGICYSSDECSGITGSYADGKCAQGFGVCCVIRWWAKWSKISAIIFLYFRLSGCGGDVSQNSTHIQNTGYPNPFKTATSCSYTFKKMNLEICFFRLEFVNFILTGTQSASAHECSVDYVRTSHWLIIEANICTIIQGWDYHPII